MQGLKVTVYEAVCFIALFMPIVFAFTEVIGNKTLFQDNQIAIIKRYP